MWQDTAKRQQFVLQELGQLKKRGDSATAAQKGQNDCSCNSVRTHLSYLSYLHLQVLLRSVNYLQCTWKSLDWTDFPQVISNSSLSNISKLSKRVPGLISVPNGSQMQNTQTPAWRITGHVNGNHRERGSLSHDSHQLIRRCKASTGHQIPFSHLQTGFVWKRATKPHLKVGRNTVPHFYLQKCTINLYPPGCNNYRQQFFSFFFLVFLGVWNSKPNTAPEIKTVPGLM